ncbi:methyltransferase domain-containing protein [Halorhodospira halophila]|uniref:Thiopurine S-methyltransferase n=1 Tax=Halorhodospira halophila (strain DSM 244 / SL1) TaxID=349124 RepID=A1WWT8_HALHL|nr:methyltransferase domain-containing protein [Halorhodospira halophila]ABM62150.1 thiopurine S-methyltransferase [Halorhodospira halophila SL1]MBK1729478.1 thiopurine S-methyltransferase [Halorhodospira halophila]
MSGDPDPRRAPWEARWREGRTGWDRGGVSPTLEAWLSAGVIPGRRVLVPGAGRGYEVEALARRGYKVTAVDIAAEACQQLRDGLDAAGVEARVVQADLLAWQPDTPFDAVYEQTCLCALDPADWPAYEQRLYGWLRPGGVLLALFMQTGASGGPPFHCALPEMATLFDSERWQWPAEPPRQWPHPSGRWEEAVRLLRR